MSGYGPLRYRRPMALKVDRRRPLPPTFRLTVQDALYCYAMAFCLTTLIVVVAAMAF